MIASRISQFLIQFAFSKIYNDFEAEIRDITINSQAKAYKKVADMTGITPSNKLNDYIYLTNLKANSNSTLLFGVDRAMVTLH